jgi:sulfide:quinone oxidoreductase
MSDTRPQPPLHADGRYEVVIAGGGVAALEAMIALAELARDRVRVTLVAPGPAFAEPAARIGEAFGRERRTYVPLARAARDFGADHVTDAVMSVDAARGEVHCAGGGVLPYDSLLVALGARAVPAHEHAETIGDGAGIEMLRGILAELEQGYLKRIAFVAPSEAVWTLPLYELALLTAEDAARMGVDDARLVVVSAEQRPLAAFGAAAAAALEQLLERRSIEFVGGVGVRLRHAELVLTPGGRRLPVQRTFALPSLHGPALPGLPADEHGFIPVDRHGRVRGTDGVFAAGDVTTFPIKQGGIAAQQAGVAAAAIAARHGCAIEPESFRPVLRGRLSTGDGDLFLKHAIAGGAGDGADARPVVAARQDRRAAPRALSGAGPRRGSVVPAAARVLLPDDARRARCDRHGWSERGTEVATHVDRHCPHLSGAGRRPPRPRPQPLALAGQVRCSSAAAAGRRGRPATRRSCTAADSSACSS